MLYEEPRETELAFKIADRIISIQECDGGYDYSIMDEHYREIDGGVYDDPAVDINFVLLSIVEELKENPDTNGAKGNITKESKFHLIMMRLRSRQTLQIWQDLQFIVAV